MIEGAMIWMALLGVFILLAAVWVLGPIFKPALAWDAAAQTPLDRLLDEKARVLRALKDLDEERASGDLHEEACQESRREYLERAVALNRQIAETSGVDPASLGEDAN